jgi:hypothetical protein
MAELVDGAPVRADRLEREPVQRPSLGMTLRGELAMERVHALTERAGEKEYDAPSGLTHRHRRVTMRAGQRGPSTASMPSRHGICSTVRREWPSMPRPSTCPPATPWSSPPDSTGRSAAGPVPRSSCPDRPVARPPRSPRRALASRHHRPGSCDPWGRSTRAPTAGRTGVHSLERAATGLGGTGEASGDSAGGRTRRDPS